MKNFEQIRAKNALAWKDCIGKGKGEGENVAKKVPVMIRDNGIIAAAAFALEKGEGYADVFSAIIEHLREMSLLESLSSPQEILKRTNSGTLTEKERKQLIRRIHLQEFISRLVSSSSSKLRLTTSETMAYLNYLRRFVKKEKKGENNA